MSLDNPPDPPTVAGAEAHGAPMETTRTHVLLVHYTFTKQALRMSDAMAGEMRERGCEVTQSAIEFTARGTSIE